MRRWVVLLLCLAACTTLTRPPEALDTTPDAGTVVDTCPESRGASAISDPRLTANACVFDRWQRELPLLTPAEQHARVAAYLDVDAAAISDFGNEAPLRSGARVIFIADASTPRVAGDWNGWDPTKGSMLPLAQSGYAYREEMLPAGRHSYKFVTSDGAVWSRDPAARWIEFDGIETGSVGAFNSVVYTEGASLDRGLLRLMPRVHSPQLQNDREVYVYVPPSGFHSGAKLPSLYAADGNESLSRGRFDRSVDEALKQGQARDMIVVFVALHAQTDRMDEYTFDTASARGPQYSAFVTQTLVPLIDGAFPTITSPGSRGVVGASLGGLVSAYIAWYSPATFGLVGSQSGSFFWPEPNQEHFKALVETAEKKEIRFYLDNGSPGDNAEWNARLAQSLQAKGYDFTHVVEQGGKHDWAFWAKRWPGMLHWLLPK